MLQSRYMPCDECGASIERTELAAHVCERERLLDFQVFGLRDEIDGFEGQLGAYLGTPHGRFEAWFAARSRRAA
jgi:hypothetical protein